MANLEPEANIKISDVHKQIIPLVVTRFYGIKLDLKPF